MLEEENVNAEANLANAQNQPSTGYLDQSLWNQFNGAEDAQQFAQSWLQLQCAMIVGAQAGAVILREEKTEQQAMTPVAIIPQIKPFLDFKKVAEKALKEKRGVLQRNKTQSGEEEKESYQMAYPLLIDEELMGVAIIEVSGVTQVMLNAIMRQLQWGCGWFENYYRRSTPKTLQESNLRLKAAFDLLIAALDQEKFVAAATAVSTELSTLFNAERVSVGLLKGRHIQVQGVSHTATFDKRTNFIRTIGMAMDECMDQKLSVVSSEGEDTEAGLIDKNHQTLMQLSGVKAVCTVPFFDETSDVYGAITIEHDNKDFFELDRVQLAEKAAELIGPILQLKHKESKWIGAKNWMAFCGFLQKIVGPKHYGLKTFAIAMSVLILVLTFVPAQFRIHADATIEGWIQRSMAAPFDGYIARSYAKAGDLVNPGDRLYSLDDKDLQLELLKWRNQKKQVEKQYRQALTEHDKPRSGVLRSQREQAEANILLLEEQLRRAHAVAPFKGMVVMGDLTQQLGAPVVKGDVLMQVAPLDNYRVVLNVDERDIIHIEQGQAGVLRLAAMPEVQFELEVKKVTPVSQAEEGLNSFLVEAQVIGDVSQLRPGMQGTGKVEIGYRKSGWVYTRKLVDWMRIWFWKWVP